MSHFGNYTFTFDVSAKSIGLDGLKSTAELLPDEYLQGWLYGFIEKEQFEEAAIIRNEIDRRKRDGITVPLQFE